MKMKAHYEYLCRELAGPIKSGWLDREGDIYSIEEVIEFQKEVIAGPEAELILNKYIAKRKQDLIKIWMEP